jgi:hypothetical protein
MGSFVKDELSKAYVSDLWNMENSAETYLMGRSKLWWLD